MKSSVYNLKRVPAWCDRVVYRTKTKNDVCGPSDLIKFETDVIHHLGFGHKLLSNDFFGTDDAHLNYPTEPKIQSYTLIDCQFSDHRPVALTLIFDIIIVDDSRKDELSILFERKRAELEDFAIPQCSLPEGILSVGEDVLLKNVSSVQACWSIGFLPLWISVQPENGVLNPLESQKLRFSMIGQSEGENIGSLNVENGSPLIFFISQS